MEGCRSGCTTLSIRVGVGVGVSDEVVVRVRVYSIVLTQHYGRV